MRYCGKIGYRVTYEKTDENGKPISVWVEDITERPYKGDVLKNYSRNSNGESINDNFHITNSISIVADPYALSNFTSIIYCIYLGVKWKVTAVDASSLPRLVLTLGGVYNETTNGN